MHPYVRGLPLVVVHVFNAACIHLTSLYLFPFYSAHLLLCMHPFVRRLPCICTYSRVQLTVNLPKLEPFFDAALSEDDLEHASGDSDKWHSPSPATLSPHNTINRDRGISPISESTEPRMSWTLDVTSDMDERRSREGTPCSPTTPTIRIMDNELPGVPA